MGGTKGRRWEMQGEGYRWELVGGPEFTTGSIDVALDDPIGPEDLNHGAIPHLAIMASCRGTCSYCQSKQKKYDNLQSFGF